MTDVKAVTSSILDTKPRNAQGAGQQAGDRSMSGPEELRALVEALKPFAWIGQWLFARNLPDDTPMVLVEGVGKPVALTRGMFKAAHAALTRAESSLASPAGMEGWTRAVRDVFEIELKINRAEPMEAMERALAAASVEFAAPHGEAK